MASSNPKPDEIDYQANGKIRLTIDGTRYNLRRPTIGQLRELEERVTEIAVEEAEEIAAAREEKRAARSFEPELLEWWALVVGSLEEKEQTLPEEADDLPAWLTNPMLIAETKAQWRTVPWGPGGKPSEKTAAHLRQVRSQG